VTSILNNLVSSPSAMSKFAGQGRALGKGTSSPTVQEVRCILPLPPLLQLVDSTLSAVVERWCDRHFGPMETCFLGGQRGSQVSDVVHGVALALERGSDCRGAVSCSQADVEKYFDSMSPLLTARWMVGRGFSRPLAAAIVTAQLSPAVRLDVASADFTEQDRTLGGLTGTRLAGSLGRVIMAETLQACESSLGAWALDIGHCKVAASSWIDNIYCLSASPGGATKMMTIISRHLEHQWHLKLKPSSRLIIQARGAPAWTEVPQGWREVDVFPCLGGLLSRDGSSSLEIDAAEASAWRSFFGGAGSRKARGLPLATRLRDLQRCTWPVLGWRAGRWSMGKVLLGRLDSLQRGMVCSMMRSPRLSGETDADFHRRRGREAGRVCRNMGLWSLLACDQARRWREHIHRRHVRSFATELVTWKDDLWLQVRRAARQSLSALAGRTGTRAEPGRAALRWEHSFRIHEAWRQDHR